MAYMEEAAQERERLRSQMLGGYAPQDIGSIDPKNPPIQAQVRKANLTSPGLEALLASLSQSMAPRRVKVDEMRDLQAPVLGARIGTAGSEGWRDSGTGNIDLGGLKGLKNKLEQAKTEAPQGKANLKDMVKRGHQPALTPQQQADANVAKANDYIPGLKPGVDTSVPKPGEDRKMAPPGEPAARAYMQEQRKDIPPVVGVDKNAPVAEGYKADLKFLEERGGHTTKLVDGKETHTPLTEKGSYKDLDPELAGRLVAAAKKFEADTGRKAAFGEFSRGEDVQKVYYDKYKAGTGGIAAAPGHSHHQHGTAGDLPSGSGFRQWLTKPENGDKFGLHFPVAGDEPHVEMKPSYKGPAFAKADTPTYGPGVVDTSKLPAWNKDVAPKYNQTEPPPGGWPDPSKTTDPSRITMPEAPVTGPNVLPESLGGPPAASVEATGDKKGVPAELQKLVMNKEWFVDHPVDDYGRKTIGYGTDARGRTSITEAEARAEMNAQLRQHLDKIDANFPNISPGVRNSLASLTFNVGDGWITEPNGKLAAALKRGDMPAAKEVFKQFVHVRDAAGNKTVLQGLVNRRNDEARAFDGQAPQYTANPDAPKGSTANPNQEVKVAGPPMAAPGDSPGIRRDPAYPTAKEAAPPQPPAPAPAKPPEDPYRKSRPAHDFLDSKVGPLVKAKAPEYYDKVKQYGFENKTVREALQHPLAGSFVKSQLMPHLSSMGIDPAEFEKAINSPPPPPPPKVTPSVAPKEAVAPPPPATPPLTPDQVKTPPPAAPTTPPLTAAEVKGTPTTGTTQGDIIRADEAIKGTGGAGPGTIEVAPPATTTEISVRPAPTPSAEPGPAAEGARGGEAGTAAPAALPADVKVAPDAAEAVKPEGAGAGDSTTLPAIEVEEGTTAEPAGFYGSPDPNPPVNLAVYDRDPNSAMYKGREGSYMVRDETIAPGERVPLVEGRKSTNIDDRRLENYQPTALDNVKSPYTKEEIAAAHEAGDSPMAKELGSTKDIAALEAEKVKGAGLALAKAEEPTPGTLPEPTKAAEAPTLDPSTQPAIQNEDGSISTVRTVGMNVDGKEVNLPTVSPTEKRIVTPAEAVKEYRETGKHLGKYDTVEEAEKAAVDLHNEEAKQISTAAKGEQPPTTPTPVPQPALTPEQAKAAIDAVKDQERAPSLKPQADAQPVVPATEVAPPQPGAPGGPLSLAPPGLASIGSPGGAMTGTPGTQGGGIAMLGLAPMPVNNAVFSTPLLDQSAQAPQMGQGSLAPFPWQETAGWGWGGGGGFDMGGGGFSDFGGGLGSGTGFFGSSFGG